MAVRSRIVVTNAAGAVLKAGGPCKGIAILAGKAAEGRAVGLGGFPVAVGVKGGREPLIFANAMALYDADGFGLFDLQSFGANEAYQLVTFDHPSEGAHLTGQKVRGSSAIQDPGTAMAVGGFMNTAAPVDGDTSGYAVRPCDLGFQFTFDGTARDVDLYVQTLSGKWFLTERIINATDTWPAVIWRDAVAPFGRLYLKASGAAATVGVDRLQEAG